ncbi:MAG: 4-hydroxybutyryl-CoA dehydratase, partial [Proteobacteria bacterium]
MNDMTQGQHTELTAEQQWEQFSELKTAEDYINSLRDRNLDVFLLGERIDETVDHPI